MCGHDEARDHICSLRGIPVRRRPFYEVVDDIRHKVWDPEGAVSCRCVRESSRDTDGLGPLHTDSLSTDRVKLGQYWVLC